MAQWEGDKVVGFAKGQTGGSGAKEQAAADAAKAAQGVAEQKPAPTVKSHLTPEELQAFIMTPSGGDVSRILYNQPQKTQQDIMKEQYLARGGQTWSSPAAFSAEVQAHGVPGKEYQANIINKPIPTISDNILTAAINENIPKYGGKQEAAAREKARIDAHPFYEETRGTGIGKSTTIRKEWHEGEMAGWFTPAEPGKRYMKDILGFASEAGEVSKEKTSELDIYRGSPVVSQLGGIAMVLPAFGAAPKIAIGTSGAVMKIGSPSLFLSGKLAAFKETSIRSSSGELLGNDLKAITKTSISFSKQTIEPLKAGESFAVGVKSTQTGAVGSGIDKIIAVGSGKATPSIAAKITPEGTKQFSFMKYEGETSIGYVQKGFGSRIKELSEIFISPYSSSKSPSLIKGDTLYKISAGGQPSIELSPTIKQSASLLGAKTVRSAKLLASEKTGTMQSPLRLIQEFRQVTPQKSDISARYLFSNEMKLPGIDTRVGIAGGAGFFGQRTTEHTRFELGTSLKVSPLSAISTKNEFIQGMNQRTGQSTSTSTSTRIDIIPALKVPQIFKEIQKEPPIVLRQGIRTLPGLPLGFGLGSSGSGGGGGSSLFGGRYFRTSRTAPLRKTKDVFGSIMGVTKRKGKSTKGKRGKPAWL